VGEGDDDEKYPHNDIAIKVNALIKLACILIPYLAWQGIF
jgi:hypothetical protein